MTLISNLIKIFKNSLSLLYFLLTLYSTFAQLSSIVEQMCLLKILLYSTLRISVFTHTLGKIHFLLCFACLRFLCDGMYQKWVQVRNLLGIGYSAFIRIWANVATQCSEFWPIFQKSVFSSVNFKGGIFLKKKILVEKYFKIK